jgi:hypothetical protein
MNVRGLAATGRDRSCLGDGFKIMLFDEPSSGFDPELVGEVVAVMRDLALKHALSQGRFNPPRLTYCNFRKNEGFS